MRDTTQPQEAKLESTTIAPDIYPYPYHRYPRYDHFGGSHHLMGLATWLLAMALLVALIRVVWKKGDK